MRSGFALLLSFQIFTCWGAAAQGATPAACLQLLGPTTPSKQGSAAVVRTFLSLIDVGLNNVISERQALIQGLQLAMNSQNPFNPFLNLDEPLARALAKKVELLLPDLDGQWTQIQQPLAERLRKANDSQEHKKADRAFTRSVLSDEPVHVPIEPYLLGGGPNETESLVYAGQTDQDYIFATLNLFNTVIRTFRVSKYHPRFIEMSATKSKETPAHDVFVPTELNEIDVGCRVQVTQHQTGWETVKIFEVRDDQLSVRWRYIDFLCYGGSNGNFQKSSFQTFVRPSTQEEFILYMYPLRSGKMLSVYGIHREHWTATPIVVHGGPGADRDGNRKFIKNRQGEVLLQFSTVASREVALWKFDPTNLTFELLFHKILPSHIEESLGARIDYETKSLVGWVLPSGLMVFRHVKISAGEGAP